MFKVLKPFTTKFQRFSIGHEVPEDSDLTPHTAESLLAGKFIAAPEKQASKAKKAAAE